MSYTIDRFLPGGTTWRDLFDLVIVSARKPEFFAGRSPVFQVVDESGLLRPVLHLNSPGVYLGGSAALVEEYLGVAGDQILYVGDHLYADVHVSKNVVRWRTALIVRELEQELAALDRFRPRQEKLAQLMQQKERLEFDLAQLRLQLQRKRAGYGPAADCSVESLERQANEIRNRLLELDEKIAPLASEASTLSNPHWGLIMRTGNDKSYFARQLERYADIYTSRVSNFLFQTPFLYLRAPRGSLPHDPDYTFVAGEEE
jgi:hypothetical protein